VNLKKIVNQKNFTIVIFSFIIFAFFLLYISIENNEKNKIKSIEDSLLERSKFHYNSVKEIQLWHTDNLGIYVNNKDIKPNYLISNNQYRIENINLIRLSHNKMTKQFSRYAKNFNSFYYKLISLNPLDKKNTPDEFEKKALSYLQNNPDKHFYYDDLKKAINKGTLDFLGKLENNKNCLQCHIDQNNLISGIRITIDSTEELKIINLIKNDFFKIKTLILVLSIITLFIVYWLIRYIFKQKKELETLNNNLEKIVEKRTKELNDLNIHLEDKIKEALLKNKEQSEIMIAQSRHTAMSEMISMIAHQWRQPISVISMGANNIKIDIEFENLNPQATTKELDSILEQTQYLTKTIDDFSNFFKPDKEKNIIYPEEIISDSIKILDETLKNNNIELITKIEKTDKVKVFSKELLQVLINIIKNAKEVFEEKDIKNKKIFIKLFQENKSIFIKISDNAGGIPNDILNSIFNPYFSTKKEKNGTGLGLYMSKTIVEKHLDGNLSVDNIESGAEFTIKLNLYGEKHESYIPSNDNN
jgi:signal transduction histidine kinase